MRPARPFSVNNPLKVPTDDLIELVVKPGFGGVDNWIAETCGQLASWLSSHPLVDGVYYTGLPSHPRHDLANRQQAGHGGLLSFLVHGDRQTAWSFIDRLQLIARATNIGDTRSMITHPATTTHCKLTAEDRLRVGIADNLVRLSVGLESVSDLTTGSQVTVLGTPDSSGNITARSVVSGLSGFGFGGRGGNRTPGAASSSPGGSNG